jgi:hypothetical protein
MKLSTALNFIKIISAAVFLLAFLSAVSCDVKNEAKSSDLLTELLLASGGPCTLSATSTKLVLYNAGTHNGNLGGRFGADVLCNFSANKPPATTKVHAFISISATDQISEMPANYCYQTSQPIYGPDGTSKIADNWADMMDDSIDMSLGAATVMPNAYHWLSGSNNNGTYDSGQIECNGFTNSDHDKYFMLGLSNQTDLSWISAMSNRCDTTYHLLCIGEQ